MCFFGHRQFGRIFNLQTGNVLPPNIKLYSYIDVYKLWDENYYPEDIKHFYYNCPNCLEHDINGKSDKLIKLDQIQSLEWEGVFLSPTHPKVNEYLLSIFKEIIQSIEFDGIVFDNLRYQDYFYGYNDYGIKIFEEKYQINPFDINRGIISERFGYTIEEIDSISLLWDNYRIESINNFLHLINEDIDSINLEIGAFVKQSYDESKNRWYQDWYSWIEKELVDFVIVKNNESNLIDFNYNNKQIKKLGFNYLDKVIIGLDMSIEDSILLANKILLLRLYNINKVSLYYYDERKDIDNWFYPIYNAINFNLND